MEENILGEAAGVNGDLQLTEHTVRIRRRGFASKLALASGEVREIPIAQISGINLKRPVLWMQGYLEFVAPSQYLSIRFTKKQLPAIDRFKESVETRMRLGEHP